MCQANFHGFRKLDISIYENQNWESCNRENPKIHFVIAQGTILLNSTNQACYILLCAKFNIGGEWSPLKYFGLYITGLKVNAKMFEA